MWSTTAECVGAALQSNAALPLRHASPRVIHIRSTCAGRVKALEQQVEVVTRVHGYNFHALFASSREDLCVHASRVEQFDHNLIHKRCESGPKDLCKRLDRAARVLHHHGSDRGKHLIHVFLHTHLHFHSLDSTRTARGKRRSATTSNTSDETSDGSRSIASCRPVTSVLWSFQSLDVSNARKQVSIYKHPLESNGWHEK